MSVERGHMSGVQRFTIGVEEAVLEDLRARIRATRWPDHSPAEPWDQGTDLDYLRDLLDYWADGFSWRDQERWLNSFEHRVTDLDGVRIHFVHQRAPGGNGIPLLLLHGWPSLFTEFLHLVPLLTQEFDLVIPSMPGYGFSERPARTGVDLRDNAGRMHRLMTRLGYERYGVHGTDFGSGVATFMGIDNPDPLIGVHLTNIDVHPYLGLDAPALTEVERAYLADFERWRESDRGYGMIQATRPQSLGYGLNDSPAGLAGWILEKWRSWSDSGGDLESMFDRDFLLTVVTIYWATQTITTSIRDYYDNRSLRLGPRDRVNVPTGIARFGHQFVSDGVVPREWAERIFDVRRWTPMSKGGHFAAAEVPEVVARDIAAFFAGQAR